MDRPYSIEYPEPSGPPQLTTFYSFKGGVGRTQALYNVGVRLAALRRKVLMVDVDLEAPGLSIGALEERERNSKDGFAEIAADLLLDLEIALDQDPSFFAEVVEDYQRRLDHSLHVLDVPMDPRHEGLAERLQEEMGVTNLPTGSLALLSSGRIDPDYPRKMIDVQIDEAFQNELSEEQQDRLPELLDAVGLNLAGIPDNLGLVFTAVLRFLLRNATDPKTEDRFRHVLIDSRSGLADVGGLCLRGLPDTRVVLSGLNKQNLEGTRMVLNTLSREERHEDELIVVFSPVPEGEVDLLEERINAAKDTLTFRDPDGKDQISEEQIRLLHYHPRIALEERPFTESFHQRTRIYEEYEDLTDRLLALTQSDADSLVSRALDRFQDEDTGDEHPYRRLARDLLPAAFVDAERVESVVDGFCSHLSRRQHFEPEALPLFDLWVGLPDEPEPRVLGTSANYYGGVGNEVGADSDLEEAERLFQRSFTLDERITNKSPKEERAWYGWGIHLGNFAELVQEENAERAKSRYREAFKRYQKATDIKPDYHQAWMNWGNALGALARLVREDNPERAESLLHEAFDKFERAVDIKPDKHEAWINWGSDLGNLAHLVQQDDPERAESLFQKAFDKYQRAVDIKPDEYETWGNWGIDLVFHSGLLRAQDREEEATETLSTAIDRLHESLSQGGDVRSFFWLIIALAKRDQDQDIEEAADLLSSLLEENPALVRWFDDEDAKAVHDHPELREILDEYREKVDEEEPATSDLPDDLSSDPENLSSN